MLKNVAKNNSLLWHRHFYRCPGLWSYKSGICIFLYSLTSYFGLIELLWCTYLYSISTQYFPSLRPVRPPEIVLSKARPVRGPIKSGPARPKPEKGSARPSLLHGILVENSDNIFLRAYPNELPIYNNYHSSLSLNGEF